ncbi:MAG: DUF2796 domain-containing protein [Chromatiales bacterium]|jgi:hypothetical protein
MSSIKQGIIFLSISLFSVSGQLYATESEHEQHEAHVHGEAQLLIALEGDTLEIEFLSPAMNIVGFEHQPQTETQADAVEAAIDTLKQPHLLFSLPSAAKCDPVTIEVETPLSKHDAHAHEHAHKEESHSDFTSHYHFQCGDISRLDRIEIELFKRFPGTHLIEVQSISNNGQQKIDLTPEHSTLEL